MKEVYKVLHPSFKLGMLGMGSMVSATALITTIQFSC